MNNEISRAQLLRGKFKSDVRAFLPPWAVGSEDFGALCTSCQDCATACPQGIIQPDPQKFPHINFSAGACTFCGECAKACTTGALNFDADAAPWQHTATLTNSCLSLAGTTCRTCASHCDEDAISFKLMVGGKALPIVDELACTGCGACVAPCPTNAMIVQ